MARYEVGMVEYLWRSYTQSIEADSKEEAIRIAQQRQTWTGPLCEDLSRPSEYKAKLLTDKASNGD